MADNRRRSRRYQEVVSWENIADFNLSSNTMLAKLAPVGALETFCAERLVSLSWRIRRVQYMRAAVLEYLKAEEAARTKAKAGQSPPSPATGPVTRGDDDAALIQIMKDPDGAKALDGLSRYEWRLEDSVRKTTKELERLQRLRKPKAGKKPDDPMADWPTPDQFPDLPALD